MEPLVVVITGGANGIGKALVEAYCAKGHQVIFLDKDYVKGSELEFRLRAAKQTCTFMHIDLANPGKTQEAIAMIYKMFHHINVLINNAGVSEFKNVYESSVQDFIGILQVNLIGAFAAAQMFAKLRKLNHHEHLLGRIINMASTRAFMSEPGNEAYCASKGGLVSLTHSLAMSLSDVQIQVNAIAPGWICTGDYDSLTQQDHRQHPSGRVGKPDDIVKACFYLTDDGNDFINGQTIIIDGGMTRKMIYVE